MSKSKILPSAVLPSPWMLCLSCLLLLLVLQCIPSTTAANQGGYAMMSTSSIRVLDQQTVYLPASSDSFTTILQSFEESTLLNVSHIQFETVRRSDYCALEPEDSYYCDTTATTVASDSIAATIPQFMHLVLFHLPGDCILNTYGSQQQQQRCNWTSLGVGNPRSDYLDLCCTTEKVSQGICESDQVGRLIVIPDHFQGQQRLIPVLNLIPVPNLMHQNVSLMGFGLFDINQTGDYAFLMANCLNGGLDLLSRKPTAPQSTPMMEDSEIASSDDPQSDPMMDDSENASSDWWFNSIFFSCLAFFHLILLLGYTYGIVAFQDFFAPMQIFILMTITLSMSHLLLQAIAWRLWDRQFDSWANVFTLAVFMGAWKRGSFMCLGVLAANGWGTVRQSLEGDTMAALAMFGLLYTAIVSFHDFSNALEEQNLEGQVNAAGKDATDMALIFAVLILIMDLIFALWIGLSVKSTIFHLKSIHEQTRQLKHHRIVGGSLIILLYLMVPIWIFQFVENFVSFPMFTDVVRSFAHGGTHHATIYTCVITAAAIFWRPSKIQTFPKNDVEMVMEMPCGSGNSDESPGDDGDVENYHHHHHHDLSDISKNDAASSMSDEDENDPDHPNGLPVNTGQLL